VPIFAPIASPTPVASATPFDLNLDFDLPTGDLYDQLATAAANINSLPQDMDNAPLPDEDGEELFGYIKWLLSSSTAEELFGPLGVILIHIGIALSLVLFGVAIYFALFVARLVIRFVVWLIKTLWDLLPGL
jgi:hypothetical protein